MLIREAPAGPRLIAKAWVDPAFKARLLEDGMSAAFELEGFTAPGYPLKGGFKGILAPFVHLMASFQGCSMR